MQKINGASNAVKKDILKVQKKVCSYKVQIQ